MLGTIGEKGKNKDRSTLLKANRTVDLFEGQGVFQELLEGRDIFILVEFPPQIEIVGGVGQYFHRGFKEARVLGGTKNFTLKNR